MSVWMDGWLRGCGWWVRRVVCAWMGERERGEGGEREERICIHPYLPSPSSSPSPSPSLSSSPPSSLSFSSPSSSLFPSLPPPLLCVLALQRVVLVVCRAFMSSLIRVSPLLIYPFVTSCLRWLHSNGVVRSPAAPCTLAMPVHCRRHRFWALVPDATPHLRCSTFSIPANYRSRATDRFRSAVLNWWFVIAQRVPFMLYG